MARHKDTFNHNKKTKLVSLLASISVKQAETSAVNSKVLLQGQADQVGTFAERVPRAFELLILKESPIQSSLERPLCAAVQMPSQMSFNFVFYITSNIAPYFTLLHIYAAPF